MHYVIRMTYLVLVSHPDELRQIHYVIQMTYSSILCNPDDFIEVGISSGWLTVMPSGWGTLPFLSHLDDIADLDFPQHAVVLQSFRTKLPRFLGSRCVSDGYSLLQHTLGPRLDTTVVFSYVDSHYKDETVARPSYHYDRNSYTGKTAFLYCDTHSLYSILKRSHKAHLTNEFWLSLWLGSVITFAVFYRM